MNNIARMTFQQVITARISSEDYDGTSLYSCFNTKIVHKNRHCIEKDPAEAIYDFTDLLKLGLQFAGCSSPCYAFLAFLEKCVSLCCPVPSCSV